jgi:hypothetical protein
MRKHSTYNRNNFSEKETNGKTSGIKNSQPS